MEKSNTISMKIIYPLFWYNSIKVKIKVNISLRSIKEIVKSLKSILVNKKI